MRSTDGSAMIHYAKKYWGVPLIFRVRQPFPRTIPFAVLSVSITAALKLPEVEVGHRQGVWAPLPVPGLRLRRRLPRRPAHQPRAGAFMEARSHVQWMGSKWADAVVMLAAFDGVTSGRRGAPKTSRDAPNEGSDLFVARLVHLMSLMHALALQNLRGDEVLDNLVAAPRRRFTTGGPLPWNHAARPRTSPPWMSRPDDVEVFVDASDQCPSNARGITSGRTFSTQRRRTSTPRFKFLNACCSRGCQSGGGAARLSRWAIGGMDPHERRDIESLACDRVYLVMAWIQALIASHGLRKGCACQPRS